MCAAKKKGRKPASKRKAKSGGSRWPIAVALLLPALLVGGYLYVQSNPDATSQWGRTAGKVKTFFSNLFEGHDKQSVPDIAREPNRPVEERAEPADGPIERRKLPSLPDEPAKIPRQSTVAATSSIEPLTLKQAQGLATTLFGGKIKASTFAPRAFWYDFEMAGTKKRYPFDVVPTQVSIATVSLAGAFANGTSGHVYFVKTLNAKGAEWTNEYAGAVLLTGTPAKPGRVLGSTAMEAPRGVISRYEALDIQQDGVLELVLEVESEAPGGYLFRDLAVHAFSGSGTQVLWSQRTLDDGPGVPLEVARFKKVAFKDLDGDGILNIEVEIGKRRYSIAKDFSRKLTSEKTVTTKTFRFTRGKYRLAKK